MPPLDIIQYARKETGSWAADITVFSGSAAFYGVSIVSGTSDRMHFFTKDFGLSDAYQRTLRADNTLESMPASFDTDVSTVAGPIFGKGVLNGSEVRAPYNDFALLSVAEFTSSDTPTVSVNAGISSFPVDIGTVGNMALNGADEYAVYTPTLNDLYYIKNDEGQVLFVSGTIPKHSVNIYNDGTPKLAYLYEEGGVLKYGAFDLSEGVLQSLTSSIAGASRSTSQIQRQRNFVGSIEAPSSVSSLIQRTRSISATSNGVSSLAARISRKASLQAVVQGVASLTAGISKTIGLEAVVQGAASLTARVSKTIGLEAVAQGASAVKGGMSLTAVLGASALGQSVSHAKASIRLSLFGAIQAASQTYSALRTRITDICNIVGEQTISPIHIATQGFVTPCIAYHIATHGWIVFLEEEIIEVVPLEGGGKTPVRPGDRRKRKFRKKITCRVQVDGEWYTDVVYTDDLKLNLRNVQVNLDLDEQKKPIIEIILPEVTSGSYER